MMTLKMYRLVLLAVLCGVGVLGCAPTAMVEDAAVVVESESVEEPAADEAEAAEPEVEIVNEFAALSAEERVDALMTAVREDDIDTVGQVLAVDVEINYAEPAAGLTPLGIAVRRGNLEMTKLLLEAGANAAFVDKQGNNLLHYAVEEGNAELVALLLTVDDIDVDRARDVYGSTPLIMAARDNNTAVVQLLIDNGADLEIGDDWDDTALNVAAYFGSLEVLQLLAEEGAALDVVNTYGITALKHSQNQDHADVEAYLLSLGDTAAAELDMTVEEKNDALFESVRDDDLEMVRSLLLAGADVNALEQGLTPIFVATLRDNPEMFTLLLESGADLTIVDRGESNLLHHAADVNSVDVATILLELEAIDIEDRRKKWGYTPLLLAAFKGNLEMVELLVAHGADIEVKDDWNDTPLNVAAWNGQLAVVAWLVESGVVLDVANTQGHNALKHAQTQKHSDVEAFLMAALEG